MHANAVLKQEDNSGIDGQCIAIISFQCTQLRNEMCKVTHLVALVVNQLAGLVWNLCVWMALQKSILPCEHCIRGVGSVPHSQESMHELEHSQVLVFLCKGAVAAGPPVHGGIDLQA